MKDAIQANGKNVLVALMVFAFKFSFLLIFCDIYSENNGQFVANAMMIYTPTQAHMSVNSPHGECTSMILLSVDIFWHNITLLHSYDEK